MLNSKRPRVLGNFSNLPGNVIVSLILPMLKLKEKINLASTSSFFYNLISKIEKYLSSLNYLIQPYPFSQR